MALGSVKLLCKYSVNPPLKICRRQIQTILKSKKLSLFKSTTISHACSLLLSALTSGAPLSQLLLGTGSGHVVNISGNSGEYNGGCRPFHHKARPFHTEETLVPRVTLTHLAWCGFAPPEALVHAQTLSRKPGGSRCARSGFQRC